MSTPTDAQGWLDEFFAAYYRQNPVNATFIGVHDYDRKLPDASPTGIDDVRNALATLESRAARLPERGLSAIEQLDVDLARGHLEIQAWELESRQFQKGNPAWYTGEAIFGVMSLFLRDAAPLAQRLEAATARMEAIAALLEQGRNNVPSAHPAWIERAVKECNGAIAFLCRGTRSLCGNTGFLNAADRAADAFEAHRAHLLAPDAADPGAAISAGESAFGMLLRRGHFLDTGASEVLRYAEGQADEAAARLREGCAEFGVDDWREALALLQDHRPTVHGYYRQYGDVWEECRRTAIEQDLLTWPEYPIRYVPRPEWAREAARDLYFLFYRSPAPCDRAPLVDYLVTPVEPDMPDDVQDQLLRAHNDSVIKLNHVVHHGAIGHHVQNWHAFRSASRIGQVAAVDCASRIAMFCGGTMTEGWSSYATELMAEVGFLTPLERYSQHHARLRMAARAIVDIKLHQGLMTLDEAARFYETLVAMSPAAARDEAVKNSMFPGAAMIYLTGTDLIHRLRRDMSTIQGDAFNLRAFHDRFLSYGSVPVALIARMMKEDAGNAQ